MERAERGRWHHMGSKRQRRDHATYQPCYGHPTPITSNRTRMWAFERQPCARRWRTCQRSIHCLLALVLQKSVRTAVDTEDCKFLDANTIQMKINAVGAAHCGHRHQ